VPVEFDSIGGSTVVTDRRRSTCLFESRLWMRCASRLAKKEAHDNRDRTASHPELDPLLKIRRQVSFDPDSFPDVTGVKETSWLVPAS
jgi:hypothetical protein